MLQHISYNPKISRATHIPLDNVTAGERNIHWETHSCITMPSSSYLISKDL